MAQRRAHPERVGIPGFLLGRRYLHTDDATRFLMCYDTLGEQVLVSDAYLKALNNPTPWTRQALTWFRNPDRNVYTLLSSRGPPRRVRRRCWPWPASSRRAAGGRSARRGDTPGAVPAGRCRLVGAHAGGRHPRRAQRTGRRAAMAGMQRRASADASPSAARRCRHGPRPCRCRACSRCRCSASTLPTRRDDSGAAQPWLPATRARRPMHQAAQPGPSGR